MVQMAYRVTFPINPLFAIIIFIYLADLLYLYLLNYVKPTTHWFIYLQIMIDLVCVSLLVYLTGGIESALIFLYFLSIISASILLLRKGALITASVSGILYLFIAVLTYHGIVPLVVQAVPYTAEKIFYVFFLNVFGFYIVAFLSGHLSENLKATGDTLRLRNARFEDLKEFNENVINCLSGGLVTADLRGKITFVNQSAEDITGYRMAELMDKNVVDLFGEDPAYVDRLVEYFHADKRIYRYEKDFLNASKAKLYIGISVTRLLDKDRHSRGYIFIFQDLTDLKKLEDEIHLKEKMIALGEMAAKIAHEIRNPLASISGSVQLLKNEMPLEGEQTNLMEIILRETRRLNQTLENFLIYSRPQKYDPRRINLSEVFLEAMMLLKNSSELTESHQLNYNLGAEDICYFADPNQMKQIFWNLSSNAIKAMPGGGTLEVGMNRDDKGDILIEFNDDGIGIGEEDREKLFQPFHGSFTGGTGLGLSIVYQIIENHFGKIDVESGVDRGTRIKVHLPGNVA
jgi:two-component system sensor histidine kinase PilS (NtrC family)